MNWKSIFLLKDIGKVKRVSKISKEIIWYCNFFTRWHVENGRKLQVRLFKHFGPVFLKCYKESSPFIVSIRNTSTKCFQYQSSRELSKFYACSTGWSCLKVIWIKLQLPRSINLFWQATTVTRTAIGRMIQGLSENMLKTHFILQNTWITIRRIPQLVCNRQYHSISICVTLNWEPR